MLIQQVNRSSTERVWVNITNSDGQTLTSHHPVYKFLATENTSSVSTNEGGRSNNATGKIANAVGSFVGIVDGDIADGDVGKVQVYGYHESIGVMRIVGSVTVRPGYAMGPGTANADSVGVSSVGALNGFLGPVVALDTIGATLHSLGTVGQNYGNHVFLRCM
jgi:hypothetical protein